MFRRTRLTGLPRLNQRASRASRRALARELADYASDADRNDLQLMVDASPTSAAWQVGDILSAQAHARLHQAC